MESNIYYNRYFFELVRFDFVIDEDLNVWLMEANLSPNLSSDHFPANRFMYEQVSLYERREQEREKEKEIEVGGGEGESETE